ncbi:MAG: ModD protein [Methylovirgula sp.]
MTLPLISDQALDALLAEDIAFLDLTTHVLAFGDKLGRMRFTARNAMTVACIEEAARIISRAGANVELLARSGERQEAGAALLSATGSAEALLRSWKVSQTLVEIASGIATATAAIVAAARATKPDIAIACTRKSAPGTKLLSLKAILAGGATPHRLGLSESILIFPEHCAFLGDEPAEKTILRVRRAAPEKKIVVEVVSESAALAWAAAGADVVQTEKFKPEAVASLCAALTGRTPRPLIAAAGGINAENASLYAQAGADILVTSAPYWGKPADVSVKIEAVT